MNIDYALECILSGQAILITGSGANYGAKNHFDSPFPSGVDLAKYFYEKCEDDISDDLQDASELYADKFSSANLIAELRRLLEVKSFTENHEHLYSLPWVRCYTTNYDNIPILAAAKSDIDLVPITLNSYFDSQYAANNKLCIYINGCLMNLNESSIFSEVKLTNKSYLSSDYIKESPWGELLEQDLDYAKCIVILGLSLNYDLDLQKLFYGDALKGKTLIVTSPHASNQEKRKLEKFGTVDCCGLDEFCAKLKRKNADYEPPAIYDPIYTCFEPNLYGELRLKKLNDGIIHDFYMNGDFNSSLLTTAKGNYLALVDRSPVNDIMELINGEKKAIFVHSYFGNGKTTLLSILKHKLGTSTNIPVFEFTHEYSQNITSEIVNLCAAKQKTVVIIEDFFNHISVLKKFRSHLTENIVFVLTARTAIMESRQGTAIDTLELYPSQVATIDINYLSNRELFRCVDIFTDYGLLGKHNALPQKDKKALLTRRRQGNRCFQSIMSVVIESTDMHSRINQIINSIQNESKEYHSVILLILLRRIMNLDLEINDISRILKVDIHSYQFRNNPAVRELIDFTGARARIKIDSSIVLQLILSKVQNVESVIDVLIKTARYASTYSVAAKYFTILKGVISYTHINHVIASFPQKKSFINKYYEELKQLSYYKKNHFFWLQYAISCIEIGEYARAQTYLDNAYGFAETQKDFDPFQIENQQARLHLELIKNRNTATPAEEMRKAHAILMEPVMSHKNDEKNIVSLFGYYVEGSVEKAVKGDDILFYQEACREAYKRTHQYVKNSGENDLYSNLLKKLLVRGTVS